MKKENLSFVKFLEKAFPLKDPFLRSEHGNIHNLIKWISIRVAFVLYRFGVSANTLDIMGFLLIVPSYYFLYYSLINNMPILFCVSYFFILCILSIDFMDGMLSKLSNYEYNVGNELDNLCPDVIIFFSYFVIGFLSQSPLFMIISILNCIIATNFINRSSLTFPEKYSLIKKLIHDKFSINSFRVFVLILLPSICVLNFYFEDIAIVVSKTHILVSFMLSLLWILISLKQNNNNE